MMKVMLTWLEHEILATPITPSDWSCFLEVLHELQVHDADGSLEWGVSFELNGDKLFATMDDQQLLTVVNVDRDRMRAVVDQTTKTMRLLGLGVNSEDAFVSYTVICMSFPSNESLADKACVTGPALHSCSNHRVAHGQGADTENACVAR